jgi:hypothetical protein
MQWTQAFGITLLLKNRSNLAELTMLQIAKNYLYQRSAFTVMASVRLMPWNPVADLGFSRGGE